MRSRSQHVIKKEKEKARMVAQLWGSPQGRGHQLIWKSLVGSVLHSEALTSDNYHYTVGFGG